MKLFKSLLVPGAILGLAMSTHVLADPVNVQDSKKKPAVEQLAQAPVSVQVNINQADAATLADKLNGIGLKKAQAIVSYREQNGAFKSVDDLVNVTGIGESTLEKNRSLITVN